MSTNVAFRKDNYECFLLRGFLKCQCCKTTLTGSFSKGRNGHHPYYRCPTKPINCEMGGKSFKKDEVDNSFAMLLKGSQPSTQAIKLAKFILQECYDKKVKQLNYTKKTIIDEIKALGIQETALIKKIISTENQKLAESYEQHLVKIKEEITIKESLVSAYETIDASFGTALCNVSNFLQNPLNLWQNGNFEQKRTVLKLVFADKLTYHKKNGFGTAKKTLPFKLFEDVKNSNEALVEPGGIEPPTF
ncbi:recombinase zinc ribbon domain-containing protein [Rickettsiales endosymbiont of Stachyamoeba lipophora]|uniref:zinc ribbon domain-containing protein n=1 Tax=Rickettsiales endosymbiont of Stachyamoeba lipophora TaxID=2486578 RepID=UPI000F64B162|nr:zinc ribbon domain-containing protein [Rickettsiales endosymbiont of Stachyamoeba lipophora]AZL16334.1 hypothetical protein EF513_07330 [Rickettsiales endosymbiont of Stachyamoeba lipophora]